MVDSTYEALHVRQECTLRERPVASRPWMESPNSSCCSWSRTLLVLQFKSGDDNEKGAGIIGCRFASGWTLYTVPWTILFFSPSSRKHPIVDRNRPTHDAIDHETICVLSASHAISRLGLAPQGGAPPNKPT
jgi:hypothetical protein